VFFARNGPDARDFDSQHTGHAGNPGQAERKGGTPPVPRRTAIELAKVVHLVDGLTRQKAHAGNRTGRAGNSV
jgi:hypothetical protein